MRNYFDFKLNGSVIFPYYLPIYLLYILMLVTALLQQQEVTANPLEPFTPMFFASQGSSVLFWLVYMFILFYIYRICVSATSYKGESFVFDGDIKKYIKINIVGILLSIVTLGIYSCWYSKNVTHFFAGNTSYNNRKFRFDGTGIMVFAIITITMIVYGLFLFVVLTLVRKTMFLFLIIPAILAFLSLMAMVYLLYRWYIDLSYDTKKIEMKEGGHIEGILNVSMEIFFSIITLGLYTPFATVRIYRYYMNRIVVREGNEVTSNLGCDINLAEEGLFIFVQFILTLITFGIYYPWAFCKIGEKIISKTYIETITK